MRRQPNKPVQLHLLDRRPATNRVWQSMPRTEREEVTQLVATMMQQHLQGDVSTVEEVIDE